MEQVNNGLKRNILFIDDDIEVIGHRTVKKLEKKLPNYNIIFASNLYQARAEFKERSNIFACFCDQNLNDEMKGIDFIEELISYGYDDTHFFLLTSEDSTIRKMALKFESKLNNITYLQKTQGFEDEIITLFSGL